MILRHKNFTLGDAAGDAAYKATYAATGSPSQAEAASRFATQKAVAYYAPTPVISSTPAPTPAPVVVSTPPPIIDTTPTRQTIQPVTNTIDVVSPPPIISKQVNPLIPNVTYDTSTPQASLTQVDATGAGADIPPEYMQQQVVATPEAPAVSSASIPWGLLLSAGFAAYEFMTK